MGQNASFSPNQGDKLPVSGVEVKPPATIWTQGVQTVANMTMVIET